MAGNGVSLRPRLVDLQWFSPKVRLCVRLTHKTHEEIVLMISLRLLRTTCPIGFLVTFGVYTVGSASI